MTEPDEELLELVMPFLPVATNSGPYDDTAYAAGWEMGALDTELGFATTAVVANRPIRTINVAQADLIAMRHGYDTDVHDLADGWSLLTLTRSGES